MNRYGEIRSSYWEPLSRLTLFRTRIFAAAHGLGRGAKGSASLKSVTHFLEWYETWHSYTLLKEEKEKYESRDTHPKFCWHQHFFVGKQQILLYQEIQI